MGSSPFARTNLYPLYLQSIAFICMSVLVVYPFFHTYGPVAHLGERYVRNVEVESSSLFRSTTSFRQTDFLFALVGSAHVHACSSVCRGRRACYKKTNFCIISNHIPWGISAAGSARHWQCRGQGFKSPMLHQTRSWSQTRSGPFCYIVKTVCNCGRYLFHL